MEKTFAVHYEETDIKLSQLTETQHRLFMRLVDLCKTCAKNDRLPYAALLADEEGNILLEHSFDGTLVAFEDCTAHAETSLMRKASQQFSREVLEKSTLYSIAEPCCMCTGAIYWGGVGNVFYAVSEKDMKEFVGDPEKNPTLDLPCRVVCASGQKNINVLGPIRELNDAFFETHRAFWTAHKQEPLT